MSSRHAAPSPDETHLSLHEHEVGDPHHARGGVLLLHGLGEHSARHQSVLERFAEHGFYGRTFDWPGHGRSPGRRGHFVSLRQLTHIIPGRFIDHPKRSRFCMQCIDHFGKDRFHQLTEVEGGREAARVGREGGAWARENLKGREAE